jgi:hypothetical protein
VLEGERKKEAPFRRGQDRTKGPRRRGMMRDTRKERERERERVRES